MTQIHVVIGSTGEYSDRDEWLVAAYPDLTLAEEHVGIASDRARELFAATKSDPDPWGARRSSVNVYDPNGRMDYTGTSYWVAIVELRTALPQASA